MPPSSSPPRPVALLVRGVATGAVGSAVMSATAWVHRGVVTRHRSRRGLPGPAPSPSGPLGTPKEPALGGPGGEVLDYDDSEHVTIAAATVVRAVTGRAPATPPGRRALFLLTHWGYGSAVGLAHTLLRRRLSAPAAGLVFFAGCEAMAVTLFPVLGGTPPPWRWSPRLIVVSLVQHVVYAAAVAAADATLPATPPRRTPARGPRAGRR